MAAQTTGSNAPFIVLSHWSGCSETMVRFGFGRPSLEKRLSARTCIKRAVRHRLGLKAPRGWGWLTNPRKAAYNRIDSRTTRGCLVVLAMAIAAGLSGLGMLLAAVGSR